MDEKKKETLISVIVPVYNVEDYLDECMESIVCQTYKNIEILLIVGNSTDESTKKCREWCEKDNRIVFIREKEAGLGAARNQGIEEAKGEYIVFIDSDDWIRKDYIEKLYLAITENNADMAECDFVRIRNRFDESSVCKSSETLGKNFEKSYRWILGQVAMWRIMSKKDLWLKYQIVQPNTRAEDIVTYPLLLAYADKIVGVSECLYYYRKDRKGNFCSQPHTYEENIRSMEGIVQSFRERGLFIKYKIELMQYFRKWISRMLSPLLGQVEEKEYAQIRKIGLDMYIRCFEDEVLPECLWGSFNLTRIVNKLDLLEDPYGRFQFSSMIALIPHKHNNYKIGHKNVYREFMLKREFTDAFSEILKEQKPERFFFDLLEERHDIISVEAGYYTKSDAYDEAEVIVGEQRIIFRDSEECEELWKAGCKYFMGCLRKVVKPERIYMVENYLSERHGNGVVIEDFKNVEEIRKINRILEGYYSYIKQNYPEIKYIKAYEVKDYYTDDEYEYGCYPWHLNEWANINISKRIKEKC